MFAGTFPTARCLIVMRPWIAVVLAAGAVLAASPARSATPRYEVGQVDAQRDALGILEHGPEYLEGVDLPGDSSDPPPPFEKIDKPLAEFLEYPSMQPAVQFSCAVMVTPGEKRLANALGSKNDARSVLALAALLHARSPSTVQEQHDALTRLKKSRPKWKKTLVHFDARFDAKVLTRALAKDPPADDPYGDATELEWSIRAVGVRKQKDALPRLATLCASEHLHTSLTAERSIEDFTGPDAESALADCVKGWQYNAADRALDALKGRNPALARKTLVAMPLPPADSMYRYANALVDVAAPSVVSRLIEVIPALDSPGRAIRALETHAERSHRAEIEGLIPNVDALSQERLRELAARLSD